eukprot:7867474-Alexandrium_andersonii.AAC.1
MPRAAHAAAYAVCVQHAETVLAVLAHQAGLRGVSTVIQVSVAMAFSVCVPQFGLLKVSQGELLQALCEFHPCRLRAITCRRHVPSMPMFAEAWQARR